MDKIFNNFLNFEKLIAISLHFLSIISLIIQIELYKYYLTIVVIFTMLSHFLLSLSLALCSAPSLPCDQNHQIL